MSLDNLTALNPYLSFFHPVTMGVLWVVVYAMLGMQVRQTRLAVGESKKGFGENAV